MNSDILFYIIIGILIIDFLLDLYLDFLNQRKYDDKIPEKLADVYDEEAYKKYLLHR